MRKSATRRSRVATTVRLPRVDRLARRGSARRAAAYGSTASKTTPMSSIAYANGSAAGKQARTYAHNTSQATSAPLHRRRAAPRARPAQSAGRRGARRSAKTSRRAVFTCGARDGRRAWARAPLVQQSEAVRGVRGLDETEDPVHGVGAEGAFLQEDPVRSQLEGHRGSGRQAQSLPDLYPRAPSPGPWRIFCSST